MAARKGAFIYKVRKEGEKTTVREKAPEAEGTGSRKGKGGKE